MSNKPRAVKSSDPVNARRFYLSLSLVELTQVEFAIRKAQQPGQNASADPSLAWVTLDIEQAMRVHQDLGELIAKIKGRLA